MRKIQKRGKSLSLPELIDLGELQAIQDSIAKTVGISSVISSPDGVPLTRFSYPTGFCSLIQSTEEGKRRCLLSFKEMTGEVNHYFSDMDICGSPGWHLTGDRNVLCRWC